MTTWANRPSQKSVVVVVVVAEAERYAPRTMEKKAKERNPQHEHHVYCQVAKRLAALIGANWDG